MSFAPLTRMLLVKVTSREPSFSKPLTYIPSVTSSMDIFLITQTLRTPLVIAFSSGRLPPRAPQGLPPKQSSIKIIGTPRRYLKLIFIFFKVFQQNGLFSNYHDPAIAPPS